jgi:WD40 repeat protein
VRRRLLKVLSGDGRLVISGSSDKTLKVWELDSRLERQTLEGHLKMASAVAVSEDGRFALSSCGDKTLKVWEVESGRLLRTLTGHLDKVYSIGI